MRRIALRVLILSCGLAQLGPAVALGGTYTFQPTPIDLWDLVHARYYTWGIEWMPPNNEYISQVSLFIDDINNWQVEAENILYVHLLDDPAVGVVYWFDDEGGGDAFAGQGLLLTTYTDDDVESNPSEDWSYVLTAEETAAFGSYVADGVSGFGFDPDCHYFNNGITLTVETVETMVPIPEPGTALLAMTAAGLAWGWTRRRRPRSTR